VSDQGNNRILAYDHVKINTQTLPAATVNQTYHEDISTDNAQGTVTFALADGTLPPGITLGSVEGTPTTPGTYTFTVEAQDMVNGSGILFDEQELTLDVLAAASSQNTSTSRSAGTHATLSVVCVYGDVFNTETGQKCTTWMKQVVSAESGTSGSKNVYVFGTALVKLGSKGSACKAWQEFFNTHGFKLTADGLCGKFTMKAARAWQLSVGLKADGFLGPLSRLKALE
jgi:hypothetical protein